MCSKYSKSISIVTVGIESVIIKEGDGVLLRCNQEEKRKLAPIAHGPFKATKVGTNAVILKFPKN
jgi:hypothetical protein